MNRFLSIYLRGAACLCAAAAPVHLSRGEAEGPVHFLPPVVVTGHAHHEPLMVVADPRAAAQPIPVQDGADALRGIPGMAVIRKGGTDGDPVLRGMAGSRLGVLIDGELILGGCGNRMDPPTAYIFPTVFDRITVFKGPQTVLYGAGHSAGVVHFEREPRQLEHRVGELYGSGVLGSFGRNDQIFRALVGSRAGYFETRAARSASGDYRAGNGEQVHSAYERWSAQAALAWTPDEHSVVEVAVTRSDAEAAYADRRMDGSRFARENASLQFARGFSGEILQRIEGRVYVNYVDHVMDNYNLRSFAPSAAMPNRAASNPDRLTNGGRVLGSFGLGAAGSLRLGADFQANRHRVRASSNQDQTDYAGLPRVQDARFEQKGIFAEVTYLLSGADRIMGGVRWDDWRAQDHRASIRSGMSGSVPNPTAGLRRNEALTGGFLRLESRRGGFTRYVGVGYTERFPDYWELFSKESALSVSAFAAGEAEKTAQIDTGFIWQVRAATTALSLFASRIEDFLLVEDGFQKGMRRVTVVRNVQADTLGGEATISLPLAERWSADGSLAYVRGRNRTDALPLAQLPPMEGRMGLTYAAPSWSVGGLARWVAPQRRIAVNQGNIVGQDLGPSPGFSVFSINAGWSLGRARLTGGIDNVFDRAYSEHISRARSAVPGDVQIARVLEPGRTLWLKLDVGF